MAKRGKTTLCSPETNQSLSCLASLAIFMYSFKPSNFGHAKESRLEISLEMFKHRQKKTLAISSYGKKKKNSILKNGKPLN